MEKLILPFFEGVVLAAERAQPQADIVLLYADARRLTQVCANKGLSWKAGGAGGPRTEILANAWLKHRQRRPSGKLAAEVIAVAEGLSSPTKTKRKAKGTQAQSRFLQLEEAANAIDDEKFINLLAGAQVAIKHFKPEISEDILVKDWDVVSLVYPEAVARYEGNGVPMDGARALITLECVDFRLSKSGEVLFGGQGGLWRQERYGWLEVYTEPTAAKVCVDDNDWGESPAKKGVLSGKHHVKAEKEQRRGEDSVEVKPAGFKRVDLDLI